MELGELKQLKSTKDYQKKT